MELKRAIGRRRSIRYYQSWRPVELSKIQKMLEAARRASHAGNMGLLRAVVIDNMNPSSEIMQAVTGPGSQVHGSQAPILIVWYVDVAHRRDWAGRLKELIDVGALNSTHGWSYTFAERIAGSILEAIGRRAPTAVTPGEAMDAGQAIAQATLVAYEEGLGTCCNGFDGARFQAALGLPETAIPICLQTVGYPAESLEAGGQRPRRPFEQLFHLGRYGKAFPRDPEVVEELERDGMIQAAAPLPWRKQEVRALARLFGLPE